MQQSKIEIGTPGIKRTLSKYNERQAFTEFIWNGFDAEADIVDIRYEANDIGHISEIEITDNGTGIPLHLLDQKFKPFMHTNKAVEPNSIQCGPSAIHGKNGRGRLTFFTFAQEADWTTTYKTESGENRQYKIQIKSDDLNRFTPGEETVVETPTGTTVRFINVFGFNDLSFKEGNSASLQHYLAREFAWFLELKSPVERCIQINGNNLDYSGLIGDRDEKKFCVSCRSFSVRYVRWQERLNNAYSRYYFIGSDDRERAIKNTSLNNKGDDFFHSVYVNGDYFDSIKHPTALNDINGNPDQASLPSLGLENEEVFRELLKELDKYLRRKRSPFIRKRAIQYVTELEKDGAFPKFSPDLWEQCRKRELETLICEIYKAEPLIFSNLNTPQKRTMVQLLNLTMNSSERDSLFDVLDQIVNLDSKERDEFATLLRTTELSNVIKTIEMINDRSVAVEELKRMVNDPSIFANERDHLQTHIERHYWLFGEQFHLVTAAEPDFEVALRRHIHLLTGTAATRKIDHPDKNKEMDIFAVRRLPETNEINNIVVELKHPTITLGETEFALAPSPIPL